MYASTLMVELERAGCTVIAICKPDSKIWEFLRSRNIECRTLPTYSKFSFAALSFVDSLIRERNVDVVHVHFHRDIWVASLVLRNDRGRKLLLSVYMGVFSKKDLLHRWIFKRVDAIVTSSRRLNAILPDRYPVPEGKIHFLPYGRNLDSFTPHPEKRAEIRSRYGVGESDLLIGTMVRIDPGKGALDFARSFSYLDPSLRSKLKFVIVGEPTRKGDRGRGPSPFEPHCESYLNEIQSYVRDNGFSEKIVLPGHQDDTAGVLSAMDVFVFPSHDELYSLVMLDAMATGLPIVATRAGGNLEQISEGTNGLFFTVGDSEDLADKITVYATDAERRKQHGAAARSFVTHHHDMRNTIRQLLEFYTTDTWQRT